MRSILTRFKFGIERVGRPPAVVEIAPGGVLAAALPAQGKAPLCAFQALAPDIVTPSINEPNLRSPELVSNAIRDALNQVSPQTQDVTLVLPDVSIRVFLLDFDSLPGDNASAVPILRFRLRKVVPFDVESASITYQVLSRNDTGCKVLVAIMPTAILAEYEAVVRAAEYEPGVVLSSSLAALAALDSPDPALTVSLGDRWLTTCITRGNELLLYRTLDLAADPGIRLAETQRDIAVAAAYYEDKLMSRPQRLYYSGVGAAQAFSSVLDAPEIAVVDLAAWPEAETPMQLANRGFASLAGALAGAR
jgi:type IV pilus assembly protein PilM